MKISGSSDITNLDISVVWDISGVTPVIRLTNESTGNDLASVSYWYVIKSPTQSVIHEGSEGTPDHVGVWTTATVSDAWPRPFNQIEWSGAEYTFQVFAKDGDGNVYAGEVQGTAICRPNGNGPTSKNTYGKGSVLVQVKCEQARIYFQDTTNTSYKGLTGVVGSSVLRVNFPMDETGNVPTPFAMNHFSSAMVPVTYSGKGYQFLYTSIYEYDFGNNTSVRIKYLLSDTFGVWCNIDLMPLLCEYKKLIASVETGSCADAEAANRKLMLINPKFSMVVMGIFQPLTGIDVPALIEEIKVIGDFDCDCCNAATGITPPGSSAFDGYTFTVVPTGGDVDGQVVANGFNIQIELDDISYVFKICDQSPAETTAFTVEPTTAGFTKTYCLRVDVTQLAEDILNIINSNSALVNMFNSIVLSQGGNFTLLVDGGCIFSIGAACDYEFVLENIPASTTFAQLKYLVIPGLGGPAGVDKLPVNYAFNQSNLAGLQAALNALGYGTFVVVNSGGGVVTITSANNTNDISNMAYAISTTTLFAGLSKDCTGFVPKSANEVVQLIIDYLCSLDDSQVNTSEAYEICYIDPVTKTQKVSTVLAGQPLATFIQELLSRGCDTINYIVSLNAVNCASLKAQFPPSINIMQPNDTFLGTKGGACASILPSEAFLYMLTYGAYSAEVLAAFCTMVNLCAGGSPCGAYDTFFATVDAGSPAGDDIDLIVTFDHPEAISHTIRYARIDNTVTPSFITIPGVLPGQSPYTIPASPALENGQYRVGIRPVYADGRLCPELFYDTPACTGITSFSAVYNGTNIVITYTAEASLESVKAIIYYPNGGQFSQIYANGDPIVIPPPAGVYGTFLAVLVPVCNANTGFEGVPTAPANFIINPPENSFVLNDSPFNITTEIGFNSTIVVPESSLSAGNNIDFYVADGTYNIVVKIDNYSDDFVVELVTGTGTYFGVPNGVNGFTFASIGVLGGVEITITFDASSLTPNLTVENNATTTVTAVNPSFYLITSGSLPLTTGQTLEAFHIGMTGVLSLTESVGDACAALYINAIYIESMTMLSGVTNFISRTYAASDVILIVITDGICP